MVKPCWVILTATWYFMSLKMDSQVMCYTIFAAQGTGRRLPALLLPRYSITCVSLFSPILRRSPLFSTGGWQQSCTPITLILKHLWGKCVQYMKTCVVHYYMYQTRITQTFFPEWRLRWRFLFCSFHTRSSRIYHQSKLEWLFLKKCTEPICVPPYPCQAPSPQSQPQASRLQSHSQSLVALKLEWCKQVWFYTERS